MDLEQESLKNSKIKAIIYYARSGRILATKKYLFYSQLIGSLLLAILLILHLDVLSYLFSYLVKNLLEEGELSAKSFYGNFKLYYVSLSGRFPTIEELFFYTLLFIIAIFLQLKVNYLKPLKIFINFFLTIFGVSLFYFFFFIPYFPYTLSDFSYFYILIELILLSIIPLILGFSTAFLNFTYLNFILNFLFVLFVWIYALLFGIIRYVVFLLVIKHFSYIWMANAFFNFGPLLDTIYLSGFYGLYLSLLSKFYRRKLEVWRWIF